MSRRLSFSDHVRQTLTPVLLQVWERAETASHDRHAACGVRNYRAARAFADLKNEAVMRAVAIAPGCFRTGIDYIEGQPWRSVSCRLNGRSLHVPMSLRLPICC